MTDCNSIDQIKTLVNPLTLVKVIIKISLILLHHNSCGDALTEELLLMLQKKRSANILHSSKLE